MIYPRNALVLVLCLAGVFCGHALANPPLSFNREIRPILSDNCFACHGPDANTRKANLRLDREEDAFRTLREGVAGVVRGNRAQSAVWQRISSTDPDEQMPPPEFHKTLSPEQIEKIGRWIDEGAAWEAHWSFVAPVRPVVPGNPGDGWSRNPIDSFIVRKLRASGLEPSPEADRRTLIRRLTFDLTGLPPTAEEIAAFEKDDSPEAYANLVDRLLASPHYGEHMARYWLDAARYADTNGYHIDNERFMYPWRDWVIKAFNDNLSYEAFTLWQIAGDLLPDASKEQKIASGFNRNHMINFEGGAIPEEYRTAYVMDRVNTTSTVWLGLTASCASCHDHKYDPLSQKEYYQLSAFFNTIKEEGLDGRDGNAQPLMKVATPEQEARQKELRKSIRAVEKEIEAPMPELDTAQAAWEAEWSANVQHRWSPLVAESVTGTEGILFNRLDDGSYLVEGENPEKPVYEFVAKTDLAAVTALRLDALADERIPNKSNGRSSNGNFVLTTFEAEIQDAAAAEAPQPIKFVLAQADYAQPNFDVALAIDADPASGWASNGHEKPESRSAYFVPAIPVSLRGDSVIRIRMKFESGFPQHAIGRFKLSLTTDPAMRPSDLSPWYVNGPFRAPDGETAYTTDFGPEAAFAAEGIDLTAAYPDGRLQWSQDARLADGVINDLYGDVAATYLYRTITSPGLRNAVFMLGSNDAIKVWLNGQVVHDGNVKRAAAPDQDTINVLLGPGENRLLVKVVNYGSAYAFFFRKDTEQLGALPLDIESVLALAPEARSEQQQKQIQKFYRSRESETYRGLEAKLNDLRAQQQALEAEIPTTMVMAEQEQPRETFILHRGQYDQLGERVEAGTPAFLPPMPDNAPRNRLGLAQWLVDPANPLPARVTVNRLWQQFFGTGLVKSVEDFGLQSEWPLHQELLDWLAVEFIESGWDVQHLLRLIVSSSAYRQGAQVQPEHLELDPNNRLLARAPRLRLEAEVVRDNALAVSGLLVKSIGGRSVNPYQPAGLWEAVSYGAGYSAQNFVQDKGDALYRRSMYTFWKRQSPPANMATFDAPNREICTVRRSRTNTPLQALVLMNDVQFVEAARFLAERMLKEGGAGAEERMAYGFELVTARRPSESELGALMGFCAAQHQHYTEQPEAAQKLLATGEKPADTTLNPVELAAWTTVANLLLNLDEAITRS